MKRSTSKRLAVDGGANLGHNPFAGFDSSGLPAGPASPAQEAPPAKRGRVDLAREVAGRGGKTVTVVRNFSGVSGKEREAIARSLQKALGCGGTIKEGAIELQGDRREAAAAVLRTLGFRPVFSGG